LKRVKSLLAFICFFIFCSEVLFSQLSIKDSLLIELKNLQKQEDFRKDTTFINTLYAYGVGYGHYNLDTLKLLANETLELSDAIGYEKGKIQGHILKGTYNSEIGNQDQAIVNFSYGLKLAKEERKYNLLLRAKSSLATEYIYKEEYAKALKEYLNAIEIAKEVKNDKSLAILYINIKQ